VTIEMKGSTLAELRSVEITLDDKLTSIQIISAHGVSLYHAVQQHLLCQVQ